MRILFVQETDWMRRNPIVQHHLLEILSVRGHEVRVIDYEIDWSKSRYQLFSKRQVFTKIKRCYEDARITLIRPGIVKAPVLDYVSVLVSHRNEVNRQMKEWSPDVIVGVTILSSYWGERAARSARVPFIYYCLELSYLHIPFRVFQPLGKEVVKRVVRRADGVLAVTKNLQREMLELGAAPEKTQVLPIGVNIEGFNPNIDGKIIRREYGFAQDARIMLFVGYIYAFSGLKEVCLQLCKTNDSDIKLLVVGDGEAYDELRRTVNRFDLEDRVILTGRKPATVIPYFIAAADVCILPAQNNEITRDLAPTKVYEYMAGGKPVISTKTPGMIDEFGVDNGVVYVDQPKDVVAKAVEIINSADCESLAAKARKYVEQHSWNRIADTFDGILKKAIMVKSTI